jgi:hypothetical protein
MSALGLEGAAFDSILSLACLASLEARCTSRNSICGSWLTPAFLFYAGSMFASRFRVSVRR